MTDHCRTIKTGPYPDPITYMNTDPKIVFSNLSFFINFIIFIFVKIFILIFFIKHVYIYAHKKFDS